LSSSDSDSGIANHNQPLRTRKIRYTNRRSPDGCPEPVESKTLEEYENEMSELRQAMEVLQAKLNRAEERIFNGHPQRPKSSTVSNTTEALLSQEKRLSTASARELEIEGLLQRLLSAEEEMKREQELLSALDQKQKLIDAQEQKVSY
jgi:predicted  nucleic acid-binding Zn-ribbon protein